VQWVVNAFTLPLAALLLLGGALGDHFGRRALLVIGTTLFALASLACALAPSLTLLLVGRAGQGIGAALLLPNSLALLNAAYTGDRRGRAVGIWAAAGAITAAAAPLLGGWLIANAGWPTIFYINLPLCLGAILIALRFVPESRDPAAGRTDYPGALLVTIGLGALTYGLTLWSAHQKPDPISITAIIAGLALTAAFLAVEHRRGNKAMMPLTMFSDHSFVGLNLLTFLLYGAFGGATLLLPFVLIEAARYSPVQAGLAMLPLPIVIALASPQMGKLATRIGPRWPLVIGPTIVAAGMLLGMRIVPGQSYWIAIFPAISVMAAGMAIAVAPLTTAVLASVDPRHTGTASGLNSAVSRTGGLIATALLGAVLAANGAALIARFHIALLVTAAVGISASACALLLVRVGTTPERR
jgi:EmrB/QacA subfamily drug resistance transporter